MSLPSILCNFSEERATPLSYKKLLVQHFNVVPIEEFDENPARFSDQIVAIFNWSKTPVVTRELMEKLPKLKIVGVCSAGYNHIDVKMIRSFGVKVSNTPGVLGDSVADFGMLLLLAAGRNLCKNVAFAKSPDLKFFRVNDVCDTDIHGSTLGIVGMGEIGMKIAERARAFNMDILYHNRRQRIKADEQKVNARYFGSLSEMLPLCDYVVISVCVTPETTKMIKGDQFNLMKSSAIFINISRGVVVDHDALVQALSSGKIKFAALDVTDPEPLPRDHPLLHMSNVIVTPHCCSATLPTRLKMVQKTIDNILAALNGEPLPSEVFE